MATAREKRSIKLLGTSKQIICERTKWKGRSGFRLTSDRLDVCALSEGGAVAQLRLRSGAGPQVNALWEAPWRTLDPLRFRKKVHEKEYGQEPVGKFLAGFTGHVLCLDYFGVPSEEEIAQGLCLHGEASVSSWRTTRCSTSSAQAAFAQEVKLTCAGLRFRRELSLRGKECVVFFSESVRNPHPIDHFFHWTQHVTFGPPFLAQEDSTVFVPGTRAITYPHGYEGKSLVKNSQEFTWPSAPAVEGGTADLSRPFATRGTGFVAGVLLNASSQIGYFAVSNAKFGLVQGYVFPRAIFPWVTIWEENLARTGPPWNGRTQARGIEFGTTPLPLGKWETFRQGPLFGVPTFCRIPASSDIRANYAAFLCPVNGNCQPIRDIRVEDHALVIESESGNSVSLPARDIRAKLAPSLGNSNPGAEGR